jgi:hypothetical protein
MNVMNTPNIYGIIISQKAGISSTTTTKQVIDGNVFVKSNNPQPDADVSFSGTTEVHTTSGPVVCYVKGTKILTNKGYVPIEEITKNHKIVIKGKIYNNEVFVEEEKYSVEPIRWLGHFTVRNLTKDSSPICIQKNALGKNKPFEDLYVSPCHGILFNDTIIHAKKIVNKKTIFQDNNRDSVDYYHLELRNHHAILANGILSESYLDMKNRNIFFNNNKKITK